MFCMTIFVYFVCVCVCVFVLLLFHCLFSKKDGFGMILEFCECGTLYHFLHDKDREITFREQVTYALDVAQGIEFLHNLSPMVIHRDLKRCVCARFFEIYE